MLVRRRRACVAIMANTMKSALLWAALVTGLWAQPAPTPTIVSRTAAMRKIPGYFPLYWDDRGGRMFLEIDKWDSEFLYVDSLPAGLGSNDIGLDRGQLGASRIVKFQRSGPRILLVEPNYRFRAANGSPEERRVVEQSYVQSVIWGFDLAAEEEGRVLVDATQFYLRDVHNAPQAIQRAAPVGGRAASAAARNTRRPSARYLPARYHTLRLLSPPNQEFPEKH